MTCSTNQSNPKSRYSWPRVYDLSPLAESIKRRLDRPGLLNNGRSTFDAWKFCFAGDQRFWKRTSDCSATAALDGVSGATADVCINYTALCTSTTSAISFLSLSLSDILLFTVCLFNVLPDDADGATGSWFCAHELFTRDRIPNVSNALKQYWRLLDYSTWRFVLPRFMRLMRCLAKL